MSDPVDELAPQACVSCREKKRKCSREVPVCSLCRRNRRPCHYPPKTASPFAESSESYIRQNTFPAIFFLDLYTFNKRRSVIPAPTITLPDKYYKALGSREQLHYHVDNYFSMIHPILPIVSKLRIYHQLSKSLDALDADLVLLFLAMQMHCERDGHNPPRTEIYDLAKQCCLHAEQSNMFSPRLLQASLLIAMYEVGNAIYPAAYLTVGHCARLGHVMGINNTKDGPQMFSKPESWAEAEERRRAWWAVIMLDRYVTLGGGNRPFACSDANPGDLLPMDEESWEKGEPTLIQPLVVSEYTAVRASPFARTSQASHLLSHVLRHVNDGYEDVKFHYEEAIQLHRTIDTFSLAISHELNDIKGAVRDWTHTCSHFTAMAICYSAQITLYDTYWCADADAIRGVGIPEQLEMQQISINGIKSACFAVHQLAKMISEAAQIGDMCRVNPLTTDCLYQASMLLHSYIRETGNNEYAQAVIDIVQALKVLAGIWDVASMAFTSCAAVRTTFAKYCAEEYLGMLDIESLGLDEQ